MTVACITCGFEPDEDDAYGLMDDGDCEDCHFHNLQLDEALDAALEEEALAHG